MVTQSFIRDFNNALLVTSENHPEFDLSTNAFISLLHYFEYIKNGMSEDTCISNFLTFISRTNKKDGTPVREKLRRYYVEEKINIPMGFLKILYNHTLEEFSSSRIREDRKYAISLFNYKNIYEYITSNNKIDSRALDDLMKYTQPIISSYIEKIVPKQIDINKNSSIIINDANYNISNKIVSNISNGFLLESYHGSIMNGRVRVSTDIGYSSRSQSQQDAVLCLEKDGCSINIIADGTGGGYKSELASAFTSEELARWFNQLDIEKYKNVNPKDKGKIIKNYKELSNMLSDKVSEINDKILRKYPNSSTTLVMAMVFPAYTIISNCGDSTAYSYDYISDELHLLSKIESPTGQMDYEAARHDSRNNLVYNLIGTNIYDGLSSKLIFNTSTKKILLSSDGVTDLISFRQFKKLMKSRTVVASDFVNRAKYLPDVENTKKKMDNISAITIDIGDFIEKGRGL